MVDVDNFEIEMLVYGIVDVRIFKGRLIYYSKNKNVNYKYIFVLRCL